MFENAVASGNSVGPATDSQHTDSKNAAETTKAYEDLRTVILIEREKKKNDELFTVRRKSIVNGIFNVYE